MHGMMLNVWKETRMDTTSSSKRVSSERWKQAQDWELVLWESIERKKGWKLPIWIVLRPFFRLLGLPGGARDDYNYWWEEQFGYYRYLPARIGNYIELGCGPYTNTRLILKDREADYIFLNDPLIRNYVRYKHTWLAERYRAGDVCIDPHPAEDIPFADESFDVVVMINVLDHVRDVDLCLHNATRITKKGGVFLLGQDLTNQEDILKYPHDVGHPIHLHLDDLIPHLKDFSPIYHKNLTRSNGRNPDAHYATLIFAGQKNLSST